MTKQGATPNKPSNSMETLAKVIVGVLFLAVVGLFIYLLNPFSKPQANSETVETIITPKTTAEDKQEYQFYDLLREQNVTGASAKPIENTVKEKPDAVVIQKKTVQSTPKAETDSTLSDTVSQSSENHVDNEEIVNKSQLETQTGKEKETGKTKSVIENVGSKQTYILQINSFDNADDADRRRAEVLMAGVDAQIVKKRLQDDTIIYQVISRQMPNAQLAQLAQQRLQNSGIDSLIVEQRHNQK